MVECLKVGYEVIWNVVMEVFLDVKVVLGMLSEDEFWWCRSWVYTRVISGKLGDVDCVFLVLMIDLVNYRVEFMVKYGVSVDGKNFEFMWNEDLIEGSTSVANIEVFISYGDRMNNVLFMFYYGFIDDENCNEWLFMEFIVLGVWCVYGFCVVDVCKVFDDVGDKVVAFAGFNFFMVVSRGLFLGVVDVLVFLEIDFEVI